MTVSSVEGEELVDAGAGVSASIRVVRGFTQGGAECEVCAAARAGGTGTGQLGLGACTGGAAKMGGSKGDPALTGLIIREGCSLSMGVATGAELSDDEESDDEDSELEDDDGLPIPYAQGACRAIGGAGVGSASPCWSRCPGWVAEGPREGIMAMDGCGGLWTSAVTTRRSMGGGCVKGGMPGRRGIGAWAWGSGTIWAAGVVGPVKGGVHSGTVLRLGGAGPAGIGEKEGMGDML